MVRYPFLFAVVATFAIAGVIAILTLMPASDLPRRVPGTDKLHHFLAFAALVFPALAVRPSAARWILPLAIAYGGLIELIQPYFGRSAEWGDFVADALGAFAGALAGLAAHRLWLRRKRA